MKEFLKENWKIILLHWLFITLMLFLGPNSHNYYLILAYLASTLSASFAEKHLNESFIKAQRELIDSQNRSLDDLLKLVRDKLNSNNDSRSLQ